jgi:cardiolipin synthase
MLHQRRRRANIIGWTFFVLVFPVVGTALFLIFGGRKIRRTAETKRAINEIAGVLTAAPADAANADAANADDDADPDSADAFSASENGLPETPPSPTRGGNAITLLDDENGIATWNALCREIASAKTSIHIATYILGRDATGRELVARLAARAREGVQVRLLVDALGSLGSKWRLCAPLERAGGQVRRFMPVLPFHWHGPANLRNHRKIAIFDGQRAIIGGQNLAMEYIGDAPCDRRFRDFSVLVDGPAVAELTRIFLGDWCFTSGEPPEAYRGQLRFRPVRSGSVALEILSSGPDAVGDPLWERLLELIQSARKEITLVTPYLVPDEVLFRFLLLKLRAGVRTRLILPRRSDHPLLDFARRPYLRRLHRAGAEILFYETRMLHAKLFIIDRGVGVVGSANLDMRSLLVNFEVSALIHSPNTMRRFRLLAASLAADSKPYAATRLVAESWLNRGVEAVAHLIAPLL